MKRKLICVFLSVMLLLLLLAPAASALEAGTNQIAFGENHSWSYDEATATLTVYGNGPMPTMSVGTYPWSKLWSKVEKLQLNEGITTVAREAFQNFRVLKEVLLPHSLSTICYRAFFCCVALEAITIPRGVSSVELYAFDNCTSIKYFHVVPENPYLSNDSYGVLFSKDKTILYQCPDQLSGAYVIPNGVTKITTSAFRGCCNLTAVTIPQGVKEIESSIFTACSRLKRVSFPEGLETIGFWAFSGCSSLMEIDLPEGFKTLEWSAFSGCNSLVSLSMPKSLEYIGLNALFNMYSDSELNRNHITYSGSMDDAVWIDAEGEGNGVNNVLEDAVIHYNTTSDKVYWKSVGGTERLYCSICNQYLAQDYTDVPEEAYYWAPVHWAKKTGITTGVTESSFAPESPCTRAQIVTFLWRLSGSPSLHYSWKNPFTDVSSDAYYYTAVLWAVSKGIANGMTETEFCPEAICTRGQAVTFLWRANDEPESEFMEATFTDVPREAYYYKAVQWALDEEVTNGVGNNQFAPDAGCTRGQIVTFLFFIAM